MAIRIPILTSFDPKGLRQANAQFAKLQGSVGSLGRNFAVAGAAIAAAGAVIAKNAQSLARIERITAQTESVLKSTGTTANGTAKDIENLAGSLENLTATEAETIQEGANLLLTFKNIQNQAGAGNDIFNQTTAAMVDVARAMGTSASTEAIRLGKALNDPIKGISALSRVGIQFTEDQKAQIKALQQSGDLMGAQKVILAELQSQFGGSGAAYAKTFSGQLELMGHELGTIGEEATMAVMPALQGMVTELRALIPIIGPQLKAAIESVDWTALTQSVIGFTTFLIENATTIAKVIAAIFAINTAYKLMQVAIGITNVALALNKWWLAQVATGMTATTIATKALTAAMKLIPWVAVVAGIAAVATEIANSGPRFDAYKKQFEELDTSVTNINPTMSAFALTALDIQAKYLPVVKLIRDLAMSMGLIPKEIKTTIKVDVKTTGSSVLDAYGYNVRTGQPIQTPTVRTPTITTPTPTPGGGGGGASQTVSSVLRREGVLATRQTKLLNQGVSAGFADLILNTATTKKTFQKELAKISTPKGLERAQAKFNRTAAGQAEIAQNAAAAAAAAAEAAAQMAAAQEAANRAAQEAADREAAILAERERVYNSFLDSVKGTFSNIKNAIMGAFDLGQLGGSTNAITRNMDKLLVRLRSFATNVKSLATM